MPNTKESEEEVEFVEVEEAPSDDTLERAPGRVLTFLRGVANNPPALAVLVANGYSDDAHREGWALLADTGALPTATPIVSDKSAAEAIEALDRWDNQNFPVIRSALERRFRAQQRALFDGVAVADGAESVLQVEKLLANLASLSKGKLTDDAAKDKEADAYLEKRGYTHAARKVLAEQVAKAKSLPATVFPAASDEDERKGERRTALLALHGWWGEWATLARTRIKRRDLLVNLGLAQRKRVEKKPEPRPDGA